MNILNAFDSDILCALFAESTLFIALTTNKVLAASLKPMIDSIRKQQALAIGMRTRVYNHMTWIAEKTRVGMSIKFEDQRHGKHVLVFTMGHDCTEKIQIEVYASCPAREVSLHVNIEMFIMNTHFPQFAKVKNITITPVTPTRGLLAIKYDWSCTDKSETVVGYHCGYAAALKSFGIFL